MFTPKDLQEKTFGKAVFGGYDMQEVDEFLEPLTEDYATLCKENSVLKSKLKVLVQKLEEYRTQEIAMKKAMVAAQKANDSIIAEAQKRAAQILNDAENSVSGKQRDIQLDLRDEELRVEKARQAADSFIAAMEADIAKHMQLLESFRKYSVHGSAMPVVEEAPLVKEPAPATAETPAPVPAVEPTPAVKSVPAEPKTVSVQGDPFGLDSDLAAEISSTVSYAEPVKEVAAMPEKKEEFRLDDLDFDSAFSLN